MTPEASYQLRRELVDTLQRGRENTLLAMLAICDALDSCQAEIVALRQRVRGLEEALSSFARPQPPPERDGPGHFYCFGKEKCWAAHRLLHGES